jgi:hypothetical protein
MPLPDGLPASTLTFGPYPDAVGGAALAGIVATIVPVDPLTRQPVEVVHVPTGAVLLPNPVRVVLAGDTTASVGPLPRQGSGQCQPDNFQYQLVWQVAPGRPRPGRSRVFVLPLGSPGVVDYDLLGLAPVEAPVYVPIAVGPQGDPGPPGDPGPVGPALDAATVDSIVAGKVPGPSATATALKAAYGRATPVLSNFVYEAGTNNLLQYQEDGILIVLTYNSDGTVATSKRGSDPAQTYTYAGGNLVGVA